MNASLKELNALMKRKDVSPLVKKQAQLQAFSAEAKLEDLQRAEELENSLAEKSATGQSLLQQMLYRKAFIFFYK